MKVLFNLGQYPGLQTMLASEGLWQNLKGPTSEAGAASGPEVEISFIRRRCCQLTEWHPSARLLMERHTDGHGFVVYQVMAGTHLR